MHADAAVRRRLHRALRLEGDVDALLELARLDEVTLGVGAHVQSFDVGPPVAEHVFVQQGVERAHVHDDGRRIDGHGVGRRVVEIGDPAALDADEAAIEVLDVERDVVGDMEVHVPHGRGRRGDGGRRCTPGGAGRTPSARLSG